MEGEHDRRVDLAQPAAHRLGLRLGERRGARVVEPSRAPGTTRSAPQRAEVAVDVHAAVGSAGARQAGQRAGGIAGRHAARLALERAGAGRGAAPHGAPARAVGTQPGRRRRHVEPVDVDDGDHVGALRAHHGRQARVAAAVAAHELVRPLHRRLVGRPLARVERPEHGERRPPVRRRADALGDLHAHDLAPLRRSQRQREGAHEVRVRRRERLHLLLQLGQRAVAGAAAREPARGARVWPRGGGRAHGGQRDRGDAQRDPAAGARARPAADLGRRRVAPPAPAPPRTPPRSCRRSPRARGRRARRRGRGPSRRPPVP